MAKNKRRCAAKRSVEHRLFSVPSLSGFLKGSVSTKDLAVGVGAGLLGQGGVKYLIDKTIGLYQLPSLAQRFLPLLSGVATGVGLYYLDKKWLRKGRGKAHLIGAVAAGAVVQGWEELKANYPGVFNDYVYLPSYNGVLLKDQRMNGMLMSDARSAANLSALASINMGDEETAEAV